MSSIAAQSFAGSLLIRGLPAALASARAALTPSARVVLVAERTVAVHTHPNDGSPASLAWLSPSQLHSLGLMLASDGSDALAFSPLPSAAAAPLYYLGHLSDDIHYLASDITSLREAPEAAAALSAAGLALRDLRSLLPLLPAEDLARAGHAVALSQWHQNHRFCAKCGAPTASAAGGARRECSGARPHRHYPRTDPVIIALVLNPTGDRALLGRSRGLPPQTLTCLSGFIDVCEGAAEAVAREVFEEAGVEVDPGSVEVVGSQPWPIGRGGSSELMIGCVARARGEALNMDASEMAEVRWVSREELRAALVRSTNPESPFLQRGGLLAAAEQGVPAGSSNEFYVPPTYAIAHHLMRLWVDGPSGIAGVPQDQLQRCNM